MDSNAYTVTMQGLGGGSDQYLFVTMGLASSTEEDPSTALRRIANKKRDWYDDDWEEEHARMKAKGKK